MLIFIAEELNVFLKYKLIQKGVNDFFEDYRMLPDSVYNFKKFFFKPG